MELLHRGNEARAHVTLLLQAITAAFREQMLYLLLIFELLNFQRYMFLGMYDVLRRVTVLLMDVVFLTEGGIFHLSEIHFRVAIFFKRRLISAPARGRVSHRGRLQLRHKLSYWRHFLSRC